MVKPGFRSRSQRRVFVRLPSGIVKLFYRQRKPCQAQCHMCGNVLHGITRGTSAALQRMPKSAKTVNRKYGGSLCSQCSRTLLVEEVIRGGEKQ